MRANRNLQIIPLILNVSSGMGIVLQFLQTNKWSQRHVFSGKSKYKCLQDNQQLIIVVNGGL